MSRPQPDPLTEFVGPSAPRFGRRRDRHGRGSRGVGVLPGPLSPGARRRLPPRTRFDQWVLAALAELEKTLAEELAHVRFAVEETPVVNADWDNSKVPLATVVELPRDDVESATPGPKYQVVLFRRPIEARCEKQTDIPPLILTVLVEQLAELLGRNADDIDPRERDN